MNLSNNPQYLPRKYAEINLSMPKEYWDYENCEITNWGSQDKYEIIKKIGRGKYSEVFEGIDSSTGNKIVIKILKPVKKMKINREIKILQSLANGTNVISLLDIVRDPASKTPSLIFEYLHNQDFR